MGRAGRTGQHPRVRCSDGRSAWHNAPTWNRVPSGTSAIPSWPREADCGLCRAARRVLWATSVLRLRARTPWRESWSRERKGLFGRRVRDARGPVSVPSAECPNLVCPQRSTAAREQGQFAQPTATAVNRSVAGPRRASAPRARSPPSRICTRVLVRSARLAPRVVPSPRACRRDHVQVSRGLVESNLIGRCPPM